MATLPTRTTASFDAIKPVTSLTLLDNEFNQYVGASGIFNGGTTATKLLIKSSDAADPPVEIDQTGAGPLAEWKQNGTLKASIANSGQIVSAVATGTAPFSVASTTKVTNLNADFVGDVPIGNLAQLSQHQTAWSVSWFIEDPSAFTVADDSLLPAWIVPAGNSIAVTKIKVVYTGGSHTSGGDVTFAHVKRNSAGAGSTSITSLHLDNTNNTARTTYSADFAVSLSEGDQITCQIAARSGTISERKVTISLIGKQKFTT